LFHFGKRERGEERTKMKSAEREGGKEGKKEPTRPQGPADLQSAAPVGRS
jgi:hypothetical protein